MKENVSLVWPGHEPEATTALVPVRPTMQVHQHKAPTPHLEENPNRCFITANSEPITLDSLKNDYVIPTFAKDNEAVVSHAQFIEAVYKAVEDFFPTDVIDYPQVRVSHVVRGRIPEAINKKTSELLPTDVTEYFQRMASVIQVPTIKENINGNRLNLSVCMVKAYNRDNLNGKLIPQKFSVCVGFQNTACTNQCLFTDGAKLDFKAISQNDIYHQTLRLLAGFDASKELKKLKALGDVYLTETQFCQILGRARYYNFLPQEKQKQLPTIDITDSTLNVVAKSYQKDRNFKCDYDGSIDMWRLYNLLTGGAKAVSYIDAFAQRMIAATDFATGIASALRHENSGYEWFIN